MAEPAPGTANRNAVVRRINSLRALNPIAAAQAGVTGPMIALLGGPNGASKRDIQALLAADPAAVHGLKYIIAANAQLPNPKPKTDNSRANFGSVFAVIDAAHQDDLRQQTGHSDNVLMGKGLALTTVSDVKAELSELLQAGEQAAAVDFVIEHHEEFGSANANRLLKTLYSR